jgi:uncharacterized RDD family membrane protein YckC
MADLVRQRLVAEEKQRRRLVTPEGVELALRIADAGQRIGAFMIDLLIICAALVALTLIAVVGLSRAESFAATLWLVGFFLLRNFYFAVMEAGPRGATWGKRALGLRVVARSGERLTADRVLGRNFLREIEFYLPLQFALYNMVADDGDGAVAAAGLAWSLLFLCFPLFNRDRLRIGDLLAGTWVIVAPRRKLGRDLLRQGEGEAAARFTPAQLDAYGVYELQTLEQLLRTGTPRALEEVAATIRAKIGAEDAPGEPDEFLKAYYAAARAHMERGLLFGRRRAHKDDR